MSHKYLAFFGLEIRAMLPINLIQAIFTKVSEEKEEKDLEMVGWEGKAPTRILILELILKR